MFEKRLITIVAFARSLAASALDSFLFIGIALDSRRGRK
jgi:hypothetical protein